MRKYTLVLPVLLMALFLAFSPAKASAYSCTATVLTPSVIRGESAKVRVDVSGATEPVYVFARAQQGWSSLPLMPLYPIVQSIDGCVKDPLTSDSCRDNDLYAKVSAPGGSVTINALTNTIHTDLGSQNFKIFCSTNRPLSNYSEGTGAGNAQNAQSLVASYTVVGGSNDCQLTGSRAAGSNTESFLIRPLFNGGSWPPNFSLAKSTAQTFTITNSGTVNATIGANSQSANVTVGLSASTLAPRASTQVTVNFNSSASHETFNLTSSCDGSTHTYSLVGEVPFVCTGTCVSPPPPPPPANPYGVADGDFPILVAGDPLVITEGQTITRDVYVGNPNGRTAPVKIIAERINLPPGVNVTFNPTEGVVTTGQGFKTSATFKADGLLLAGTYKYSLGIDAGFGPSLLYARNLVMTTKNKVIPAKDAASMPGTINTLRHSIANMLNMRLESPGDPGRLYSYPPGTIDPYTAAYVGGSIMSIKSWTNPVLIMDKNAGRGLMEARYYSLADPMNPVRDFSKDLELYRGFGHYGDQMRPWSIAYSRDGKYEISNQWADGTFGSTKEYPVNATMGIPFDGDYHGDPVDIFQSSSRVYFTYMYSGGVTRLDGVKKSAPYLSAGGSTTFDWIYPELPDTAPNIPKATGNYPTGSGVNATVIAGAKDYVAVLTGPGDYRSVAPNKLSIYAPTENDPVAEINIANAPTSTGTIQNLTSFVTSDVQYVMFTAGQYLKSSPLGPNDPKRWENLLYVYKFNPVTSALTKVVEGIKIVGEIGGGLTQQSIAGIRVGNKDGVIVLLDDDAATINIMKPAIYMFSDLSAGILKDVFTDAGYSIRANLRAMSLIASLNVGVSTYVYLNTQSTNPTKGIAVIKFDPSGINVGGSPSSLAICQDSTALNHGGTLPCRYPPTPRPACSPGDLFSTDTSLPCPEKKLNCVNLSSSFYCSQVQGATAFHFTQWIALGSNGNEVIELQKFLNNAGYYTDVADGNFGAKTKAAVIKLQIANGLVGDGIVGAQTRAVLNK